MRQLIDLAQMQKEWEEDSEIDDINLDREALRQPKLHSKWVDYLTSAKIKLYKVEKELVEARARLTEYYNGRMTKEELQALGRPQYLHKTPLKSELERLLDSDPIVVDINQKFYYYNTLVEYATSVLGAIRDRGFSIKTATEYRKFLAGN